MKARTLDHISLKVSPSTFNFWRAQQLLLGWHLRSSLSNSRSLLLIVRPLNIIAELTHHSIILHAPELGQSKFGLKCIAYEEYLGFLQADSRLALYRPTGAYLRNWRIQNCTKYCENANEVSNDKDMMGRGPFFAFLCGIAWKTEWGLFFKKSRIRNWLGYMW